MKAIIASTSTVHGSGYLEYLSETLSEFYKNIDEVLFVPFARPGGISHDEYTLKAKKGLQNHVKSVIGLHEFKDKVESIQSAEAIFVGGGNTFLLVQQLHQLNIMSVLAKAVQSGTPYLGTSAGSNICGLNMQTTNDMPIVYPPSFETLGILPFNINPHYLDPNPDSKHKGETRETRLKEFQNLNNINVIGLREGSWLQVNDGVIRLKGKPKARVFEIGHEAYEINSDEIINLN
ncbi:dipeptidase PepE [Psychroflexus aestuariivivens]|uniref:dipeptidase PepE n=1 Tax=Psychroflexus aestuariivivens TaxID=1795040 RepID=UPI000FD71494|nr:dipeptidase PepE [Psychroflexus aestuariivivens]